MTRFRVPSRPKSLLFGSQVSDLYLQPHIGSDVALSKALLKGVIGGVVGSTVTLVDSAVETAREVAQVLDGRGLRAPAGGGGEFHVVLSDTSPTFEEIAARFLGRSIPGIELVPS